MDLAIYLYNSFSSLKVSIIFVITPDILNGLQSILVHPSRTTFQQISMFQKQGQLSELLMKDSVPNTSYLNENIFAIDCCVFFIQQGLYEILTNYFALTVAKITKVRNINEFINYYCIRMQIQFNMFENMSFVEQYVFGQVINNMIYIK